MTLARERESARTYDILRNDKTAPTHASGGRGLFRVPGTQERDATHASGETPAGTQEGSRGAGGAGCGKK